MTAAPARYVSPASRAEPWVAEALRLLPPWVGGSMRWDAVNTGLHAQVSRHTSMRIWATGDGARPFCAQFHTVDDDGHWVRGATAWGADVETVLRRAADDAPRYGVQLPIGTDRPMFAERTAR